MSYEQNMLKDLNMPTRQEVEQALLKSLFDNNGAIKEFVFGEKIVEEIANEFDLDEKQQTAYLETIYRKENRKKRSYLWHRLLFRAADSLAKSRLVSRPSQTFLLTSKREWMLTEKGYDYALKIQHIPLMQKEMLPIKSFDVQKIVEEIRKQERTENYDPIGTKKTLKISRETKLRNRAFKQAIREAYDFRCAICGMKICSPNFLHWEVEAAHIVPHSANGKDDVLNGLALCRLHHWAFDVGWFSFEDNFKILVSKKAKDIPGDFGRFGDYNFLVKLRKEDLKLFLPREQRMHPHPNSIKWHRENVFYRYSGGI